MSLAPVAPVQTSSTRTASIRPAAVRGAAPGAAGTEPAARTSPLRLVPTGAEARGFALYVGLDEEKARAAGTTLPKVVEALRKLAAELVPTAETYAAVALAPQGAGGRDVDIVRRALSEPTGEAATTTAITPRRATGIVVDLGRKRLRLDDEVAQLTYREFELLQYLVLREGRTVSRNDLIIGLWSAADQDAPNERTIDVHVRRLRAKLGGYQDIVRTVRGIGYRFDRHADVVIRYGASPSPDRI